MTEAEQYRKTADDCRREAEKAISPLDKERWLQLADEWLRLALSLNKKAPQTPRARDREAPLALRSHNQTRIAKAKKQTTRGRKQDQARVAGKRRCEVSYESKKIGRSAAAVKRAVK
jgi:hypothetical protein